jgi:hypothetical protein
MKTTHRICGRKDCNEHGINKADGRGTTWYCGKHYRFRLMRSTARQHSKVIPAWEHLDEMLLPCLNEHGELGGCPCCGRQMQWKSGADKKRGATISLQHNLDGTMCFVCHSCNTGHGNSRLGDRFLEPTPVGFKHCADCDTVKSLDQFHKNSSKGGGVHSSCRECQNNRSRKYHASIKADPVKRAEHLAKQRARYHADPAKRAEHLAKQRARYHANAQQEVLA